MTAQWTTLSLSELAPNHEEERLKELPIPSGQEAEVAFLTTGRVSPQGLVFSDKHLERLEKSWNWFQFSSSFPRVAFEAVLKWLPSQLPWRDHCLGVLRISYRGQGWCFQFSPIERNSANSPLSLTLYREDSWRSGLPRFLKKPQPQSVRSYKEQLTESLGRETDVLVCDSRKRVIESSIWSLIFKNTLGEWIVPEHPQSLESLSLSFIREKLSERGEKIRERELNANDLSELKGGWLTNSVRGVRAIQGLYEESGTCLWSPPFSEREAQDLQELLFGSSGQKKEKSEQ